MIAVHVRSIFNRLPEIRAKLPREAASIVGSVAQTLVTEIQSGINNRTGYLSSTIEASSTRAMNVIVKAGAYYAGYVEFGTSRNRAYPYFYPAVDRVGPVFVSRMSAMLARL